MTVWDGWEEDKLIELWERTTFVIVGGVVSLIGSSPGGGNISSPGGGNISSPPSPRSSGGGGKNLDIIIYIKI